MGLNLYAAFDGNLMAAKSPSLKSKKGSCIFCNFSLDNYKQIYKDTAHFVESQPLYEKVAESIGDGEMATDLATQFWGDVKKRRT